MTIEANLVALLVADTNGSTGVADLLTGGIYSFEAIGKRGIDPKNPATEDAYVDDDGYSTLQPLCIVKIRSNVPNYSRRDANSQTIGMRSVAEFWLYDDNAYATIRSARDRIYELIQDKTLANIGVCRIGNEIDNARDEALNNAALLRADYSILYTKTGS